MHIVEVQDVCEHPDKDKVEQVVARGLVVLSGDATMLEEATYHYKAAHVHFIHVQIQLDV